LEDNRPDLVKRVTTMAFPRRKIEVGLRIKAENRRKYSPEILTAKGSRVNSHERKASNTQTSTKRKILRQKLSSEESMAEEREKLNRER